MGSQSLAEVRASTTADSTGAGATDAFGLMHLDGEVSLHLRRLSKRDATTKLKALQASSQQLHSPVNTLFAFASENCQVVDLATMTAPA